MREQSIDYSHDKNQQRASRDERVPRHAVNGVAERGHSAPVSDISRSDAGTSSRFVKSSG